MYRAARELMLNKYMILNTDDMKINDNYREGYCFTLTWFLDKSVNTKAKIVSLANNVYEEITGIRHGYSPCLDLTHALEKCFELIDV